MKSLPYYDDLTARQTIKLRELIKTLPPFAKEFFRAIDSTTQVRTRIAYAYDLRVFFHFLIDENPAYRNYSVLDFKVSDLDKIESVDLEEYMEYLKVYISEEQHKHMQNTEQGVFRKMSALRSFYGYFYKRQLIEKNPTLLVDMPKIREKEIIRLEADEVASLLDFVEHGGDHLTGQKRAYYEKTKERDLAIITLLPGTGIRVSELVGLNIDDVDFRNNGLHLIRKGRKEMTVYFGNEVADALEQYIEGSRKLIIPKEGHEDALFYSMQRRRIGVQAVQNLVKKYAKEVTPLKKITPHKLRSTYGTALYQETDDIYLVAEVLGHSDVNTTRKHYAAMSDTRRRQAAGDAGVLAGNEGDVLRNPEPEVAQRLCGDCSQGFPGRDDCGAVFVDEFAQNPVQFVPLLQVAVKSGNFRRTGAEFEKAAEPGRLNEILLRRLEAER